MTLRLPSKRLLQISRGNLSANRRGLCPRYSTGTALARKPKLKSVLLGPKKNEAGVQLLSPSLHAQIFQNVSFPPPEPSFIQIARDHLSQHSLDTSQASVLPAISFTLPSLQGKSIAHHFQVIGAAAAEPHLSLAKSFAALQTLPPRPEVWNLQSGWTKYYADGSFEPVESPGDETMLCFDVETLPRYYPYAVMACAASPTAWYAWISPWLLQETEDPIQLIPLGDPKMSRVIIGHNVAYDRIRVKEEYSLQRTGNRWVDTMSLHVAVKGISSHQRSSWMAFRKKQREAKERKEEALLTVRSLVAGIKEKEGQELDDAKKVQLEEQKMSLQLGLWKLHGVNLDEDMLEEEGDSWESITAMNSLAEVAKLHCGMEIDKEIRDDFLTSTPDAIRARLDEYLTYCATDVSTTHAVYQKVLPLFLEACPSPVSWAGIMTMGNGFLGVDESWNQYIENSDAKHKELEEGILVKLENLAREAKDLMDQPKKSQNDAWLSQLDWTPKEPGPSRGVAKVFKAAPKGAKRPELLDETAMATADRLPKWYFNLLKSPFALKNMDTTIPLLLRLSWDGKPLFWSTEHGWLYRGRPGSEVSAPIAAQDLEAHHVENESFFGLAKKRVGKLLGKSVGFKALERGQLACADDAHRQLALALCGGDKSPETVRSLIGLADAVVALGPISDDTWLRQLDWEEVSLYPSKTSSAPPPQAAVVWPKWYWDLTAPSKDRPPGSMDLTVRNRIAPILLRLRWLNWPLFHSRKHGWCFRVPPGASAELSKSLKPLEFKHADDERLEDDRLSKKYTFYKLPHKDGDKANVGSPLAKTFMQHAESGTLTSPGGEAKLALDMNAQCSYWISVRDRVTKQVVVWDGEGGTDMGFAKDGKKRGIILPQVITMGTVTRRAIERTWLTASNAKKNRVGSELKAMVRAPPGYAIVGADVDSEELWISSLMGDAQFGLHGATALGWMTLEGQKKYGTDLHSKTAKILGVSRDQAKVFNYSRIYGAGKAHTSVLLRQANPNMSQGEAKKLAAALYTSTKGQSTNRRDLFGRKFWHGGTESFVFNKLEEVAQSQIPKTPALGCTITHALRKEHLTEGFGKDYLPSRINWVVQSSGVDYLHLLIVSMEYLLKKYDIDARYLISVHDELRYLVKEEDKYRCALALQIANLWTRCLFAYRLGMDDLPQGVAFFSAVDVDHVLRKEVDLPCVTPSQPIPIPPGEAIDIAGVLEKTAGGSLWKDGRPMSESSDTTSSMVDDSYVEPDCLVHRAKGPAFLRAQCTTEIDEIRMLAQRETGIEYPAKAPRTSSKFANRVTEKIPKAASRTQQELDEIFEDAYSRAT